LPWFFIFFPPHKGSPPLPKKNTDVPSLPFFLSRPHHAVQSFSFMRFVLQQSLFRVTNFDPLFNLTFHHSSGLLPSSQMFPLGRYMLTFFFSFFFLLCCLPLTVLLRLSGDYVPLSLRDLFFPFSLFLRVLPPPPPWVRSSLCVSPSRIRCRFSCVFRPRQGDGASSFPKSFCFPRVCESSPLLCSSSGPGLRSSPRGFPLGHVRILVTVCLGTIPYS